MRYRQKNPAPYFHLLYNLQPRHRRHHQPAALNDLRVAQQVALLHRRQLQAENENAR